MLSLKSKSSLQKGFTLIEMMVSLTLFTVVMLAGTGTMLVVLDANRKAQAYQVAMDNLGVALEGISKDMRVGTHFYCWASGTLPGTTNQDCPTGGEIFAFLPLSAINTSTNYWVYRLNNTSGKGILERCRKGSDCTDDDFSALTAPEINIKYFRIFVTDSDPKSSGNTVQSKARIVIQGVAGVQPKTQTEFSVQTTISQFQLDL